jgi:hypothetical protein
MSSRRPWADCGSLSISRAATPEGTSETDAYEEHGDGAEVPLRLPGHECDWRGMAHGFPRPGRQARKSPV